MQSGTGGYDRPALLPAGGRAGIVDHAIVVGRPRAGDRAGDSTGAVSCTYRCRSDGPIAAARPARWLLLQPSKCPSHRSADEAGGGAIRWRHRRGAGVLPEVAAVRKHGSGTVVHFAYIRTPMVALRDCTAAAPLPITELRAHGFLGSGLAFCPPPPQSGVIEVNSRQGPERPPQRRRAPGIAVEHRGVMGEAKGKT